MIISNPYRENYGSTYGREMCCPPSGGVMKVNGQGTVNAEPEIASLNLGIITENTSLQAAQRENALKANAVIDELLRIGIPRRNISTASYNIEPQYDFVEGKQIFRAYRVSNILSVTITDLARVGEVIDRATAKGVNRVDNIIFKVEDPAVYYRRALNLAVRDAALKARELGSTLGVRVNEIPCKILELGTARPYEEGQMLKFSAAVTPILPGEITITAEIEAFFQY